MNNIKKLCLYSLDCIKSTSKNSDFTDLKRSKENKVIITDLTEFEADNKDIIDIMTKYALNRSIMGIYAGKLMLIGERGKNRFYSPLLYTEAELVRNGDKVELNHDNDYCINVSLISSLLTDNDSEIVENTIDQLLSIDGDLTKIDFKKVLSGLINLDGMIIKDENALILAKTPESVAGVINELRQIADIY